MKKSIETEKENKKEIESITSRKQKDAIQDTAQDAKLEASVPKINIKYSIIIFTVAILFYCYQYMLRSSMINVFGKELQNHFGLLGQGHYFASLVGYYWFFYTFMQPISGAMLEKYGIYTILSSVSILCAFGSWLFIISTNYYLAAVGRAIIGIAASFGFINSIKIASDMFPQKWHSILHSLPILIGTCWNGLSCTVLSQLNQTIGWKLICYGLSMFGVLLAILAAIMRHFHNTNNKCISDANVCDATLKEKTSLDPTHNTWQQTCPVSNCCGQCTIIIREMISNFKHAFINMKAICQDGQCWLLGLYTLFSFVPIAVLADTFGITFLREGYYLPTTTAASIVGWLSIGLGIGALSFGTLSELLKSRKIPLIFGAIVNLIAIYTFIYVPGLTITTLSMCFFAIGFVSGANVLCYTSASELEIAKQGVGPIFGFINMLCMLSGVIFIKLVGHYIHNNYLVTHVSMLNRIAIQTVSTPILYSAILTLLICLIIKETYRK